MNDAEITAKHGEAFRRCLIEGDIDGADRLWRHVNPHLPQHETKLEREVCFHLARTAARSVPLKLRKWSDRWLRTRRIGTFLPPQHQLHPDERR